MGEERVEYARASSGFMKSLTSLTTLEISDPSNTAFYTTWQNLHTPPEIISQVHLPPLYIFHVTALVRVFTCTYPKCCLFLQTLSVPI